ncbi:MAG: hypothetical protein V2G48_01815 [bacterium JZ-2024 1]
MNSTTQETRVFASGSELLALGALDAGVRFFAGYPITPSSGIYEAMVKWLPSAGGIVFPAPDEISAISYCIGASLTGTLSLTATSGPGFALMTESMGYAVMAEIPLIVVLAQRLGPATGGATTSAQGDFLLVRFCVSGAYPFPILSPSSFGECYEVMHRAVAIAQCASTPVAVLTEKEMMMSSMTLSLKRRQNLESKLKGFGKTIRKITGSTHSFEGKYTDQPHIYSPVLAHLKEKILQRAEEWMWYQYEEVPGSRILVVTWGHPCGAVQEAFSQKESPWSYLFVKTLFPLPLSLFSSLFSRYEALLFVEENIEPTLLTLIKSLFPCLPPCEVLNSIGEFISPEKVRKKIQQMERGDGNG